MITLQHSLVTLFGLRGDEKEFERQVPYALVPDAIRRYCGPRPYSHFEETPDGKDVSYMHFPKSLKLASKENIGNERMKLAEGYRPCVLGEKTHVEVFEKYNGDLPPVYFSGVKKHLVQDVIFDEFVREGIGLDTSRRYESMYTPEETTGKNIGIYTYKRPVRTPDGKLVLDSEGHRVTEDVVLDGEGVRKLIAEIENHGVYVLAHMLYKAYGITANQEWFDEHVKKSLDEVYSQDLSDGTYQYMRIPEDIDKKITDHDWSALDDGLIPLDSYMKMYEQVIMEMPGIDAQMASREARIASEDKFQ